MRTVVEHDEPIIVERAGRPEVVILSITEYERLRAYKKDDLLDRVDHLRARIRAELGNRELTPSEEIIQQMREERDAHLMDLR